MKILTSKTLKDKRDEFSFTQQQFADILGIHKNALQKMESGKSPIPKYINNYAMCLTILNENMLFRKHIKNIGVDLKDDKSDL